MDLSVADSVSHFWFHCRIAKHLKMIVCHQWKPEECLCLMAYEGEGDAAMLLQMLLFVDTGWGSEFTHVTDLPTTSTGYELLYGGFKIHCFKILVVEVVLS